MTLDTDEAPRSVIIDQMFPLLLYIKESPSTLTSLDMKADGGSNSGNFESTLEVSSHHMICSPCEPDHVTAK